jgi:hypothetical protein
MNDEIETTFPTAIEPAPRKGVSWRTLAVVGAVMLVGGGALGGWLALDYAAAPTLVAARPTAAQPALAPAQPVQPTMPAGAPPAPLTATQEGTIATRLALLEDRLARISVAADGASGNAAKAEAMLLALAARRALDRGLPLGVIEAQLRLRFGETQPVAVNAIIAAGRAPVTEDELAAQLVALRGRLDVAPDAGILDRIRSNIDSLIVIRPSGSPSPTAANRYMRAMQALERGRIDLAIVEIEAMPGAVDADVTAWLRTARLRNDASRALDLIESAALLEPGAFRAEPADE